MDTAIRNFAKQFTYTPIIENQNGFEPANSFIISGMGGSHLAADIITSIKPELDITIHSTYGLPNLTSLAQRKPLFIASSYSGNTEEVVDGLLKALDKNLPCAVIATGGKLIDIAQKHALPYVELPSTGIQPRSALGFSIRGLLKLMVQHQLLEESERLAKALLPESLEKDGKQLAEKLNGMIPVIYTSTRYSAVGYNWKIKFNETGKVPAFTNVFPELNHNEMNGFDVTEATKSLAEKFSFIFIQDDADHPRIIKRMNVLADQYTSRGLTVQTLTLNGSTVMEKIFSSLLLADWAAFYTAEINGADAENVPMIEEFKRKIS